MRILLLGTRDAAEDTEAYYKQYLDFFQSADGYGGMQSKATYALLDDLCIAIGDGEFSIRDLRNNCDLAEYQIIFLRGHVRQHLDVTKVVSLYAREHKISIANDYSAFRTSSKLSQAAQFYMNGLPVARTVYVTPAILRQPDESLLPGLPCIMKDTYGSHGDLNFKVSSLDEIRRIHGQHPNRNFVLQRFVPNDCDYRVLIAGDNALIIRRSAAGDSHLNNTSQGATATLVGETALPSKILEQSRHIAHELNLSIAGVDVLYDEKSGEHSFLEVNTQPQLMTGAFVDEKAQLVGKFLQQTTAKSV